VAAAVILSGASAARAARVAGALAPTWRVEAMALPAARLSTAQAAAHSARAARRLAAAGTLILWPTLAAAARRDPGLGVWRRRMDATLRGSYLSARAFGLAFAARGGGRLLLIVEAPLAGDAIGAVLAESLAALADGLRKALAPSVAVAQLRLRPPAGSSRRLQSQRTDEVRHRTEEAVAIAQLGAWLAAPLASTTLVPAARPPRG